MTDWQPDWHTWVSLPDPERPEELGIAFTNLVRGWDVRVWLMGASDETIVSEIRFVAREKSGDFEKGLGVQIRNLGFVGLKQRAINAARQVKATGRLDLRDFRMPEVDDLESLTDLLAEQLSTANYNRKDLRWLAHFAARYVDHAIEKRSVVRALAKEFDRARDTIRDLVREARRRDLLTAPPGPGRAGGQLTETAKRILAGEDV